MKIAQEGAGSGDHYTVLEPVRIWGVTHNGFSVALFSSWIFPPKLHLVYGIPSLSLGGAMDFNQHLSHVMKVQKPH